ncbi:MAG: hypothetical protein U0804_17150 [Gemmataceae bacterium]
MEFGYQGSPFGFVNRMTNAELFLLREVLASGDEHVLRAAELAAEKLLKVRLARMPPGVRDRALAAWVAGADRLFRRSGRGARKVQGRRRSGPGQLAAA